MVRLDTSMSLGEAVMLYPQTTNLMNHYKLDYCCGGKDTFEVALSGFEDKAKILSEFEVAMNIIEDNETMDWHTKPISEIIDYIIGKHHTYMKASLKELDELINKILDVHYISHGEELLVVHSLFGQLKPELEAHLVKEERVLFPLFRQFEENQDPVVREKILQHIKDTEDEHDGAGDLFKALEKATNGYTEPEDACVTYWKTYKLLDELEKDTFNHIHLENTILFNMI